MIVEIVAQQCELAHGIVYCLNEFMLEVSLSANNVTEKKTPLYHIFICFNVYE